MAKPTFFQTVLRKPTRSYADPYAVSPWSDRVAEEDYPSSSSGCATRSPSRAEADPFDMRNGYDHAQAGPSRSRKARSTVSVVSEVRPSSMATRFPQPARKTASSLAVRDGTIVSVGDDRAREKAAGRSSSTVRRKKNRSTADSTGTTVGCAASRRPSPSVSTTVKERRMKDRGQMDMDASSSVTSSRMSSYSAKSPPSLEPRKQLALSESSSTNSSSVRPISPLVRTQSSQQPLRQPPMDAQRSRTRPSVSVLQKSVMNGVAPLTPPSSVMSSGNSSMASRMLVVDPQQAATPPSLEFPIFPSRVKEEAIASAPERRSIAEDTDDEDEVFYTPRASLDLEYTAVASEPPLVITPQQTILPPPSFNLLPPTPAPVEPQFTPFHSEPASPTADSLHLNRLPGQALLQPISAEITPGPPPAVPEKEEEHGDAHSAASDVGSDEDEESERNGGTSSARRGQDSRTASFSSPLSFGKVSRPPSPTAIGPTPFSVEGKPRITLSRQSTSRQSTRRSFDDFVVNRRNSIPLSEVSFGARSVVEGSLRNSISGYGKGGWAAAAAVGEARSRASSPMMMYMPTAANDGWETFQPPQKQTRFTPLPAASQPATFDMLVSGTSPQIDCGRRAPKSDGELQIPTGSSPSEYSQLSDEEDLPRPSRSYAKRPATDNQTVSSVICADLGGHQLPPQFRVCPGTERRGSAAPSEPPVPPPKNPFRRLSENIHWHPTPAAPHPSHRASVSGYSVSRSNSIYMRPNSPLRIPPDPRPYSYASGTDSSLLPYTPEGTRPTTPAPITRGFDAPSFLNPDTLTLLPEMTAEASARTYRLTPSDEPRRPRRASWQEGPKRSQSVVDGRSRYASSDVMGGGREAEDGAGKLPKRAQSALGHWSRPESRCGGSSYGEGVLMQSDGVVESISGYTNLVLPAGAYMPSRHPSKTSTELSSRILGLPHATMASITLSTAHRLPLTPLHLRANLPPLVDFSSHLKPPTKVAEHQCLIQVYAVAVDGVDVEALEEKGRGEVGKWVPGRSFVGRCLAVGADEKDVVRGDIVIGLLDIRKSGALSEYIAVYRRRLARAPSSPNLSLEQMSLFPLQGIPAARAVRTHLNRHSRALIMDAHTGVSALICQVMAKAGVNVTALVSGGEGHHEEQTMCMTNGAKDVLAGTPAAVMLELDEEGWDYVLDTVGGQRVYEAARRMLRDGGKLVSLKAPDASMPPTIKAASKPSGLQTLRAVFTSRRKGSKFISFHHLVPAGSGEPEVDSSGMDCRDVLEEACMAVFRPVVRTAWPFEKGMEAFRSTGEAVIRLI